MLKLNMSFEEFASIWCTWQGPDDPPENYVICHFDGDECCESACPAIHGAVWPKSLKSTEQTPDERLG